MDADLIIGGEHHGKTWAAGMYVSIRLPRADGGYDEYRRETIEGRECFVMEGLTIDEAEAVYRVMQQ